MKQETTPDIKNLTEQLLNNPSDREEVERIINEIHSFFQEITSISGQDTEINHLAAVPAAKGVALGLNHAAQCLVDYARTTKFLTGVIAAIRDKQQEHPGATIEVFYAGCGPYAPFITLVAPLFQPNEVQFSLLEINGEALESAKKLITALEQEAYVRDYFKADAVTFEIPNANSFHVLISETLDSLLYRECYVPIVFNLLPQLPENTAMIPENIRLNLSWIQEIEGGLYKQPAANLLDIRACLATHKAGDPLPAELPTASVPRNPDTVCFGIVIDTEVLIYKGLTLDPGESSLSVPFEMAGKEPTGFTDFSFTYQLGEQLELKYEFK